MTLFMELENVRLSYDPKTDTVRLTSSDPRFNKKPFSVALPNGSTPNSLARDVLAEAGLTAAANKEVAAPAVETKSKKVGKRSILLGLSPAHAQVHLTENEIRMHGIISGATGSGSYHTAAKLATSLLELGWEGLVIDSNSYFGDALKEWAAAAKLTEEDYVTVFGPPSGLPSLSGMESRFNPFMGLNTKQAFNVVSAALPDPDSPYLDAVSTHILKTIIELINYETSKSENPNQSLALERIIYVLKEGPASSFLDSTLVGAVDSRVISARDLDLLKTKSSDFEAVTNSLMITLGSIKNLKGSWLAKFKNSDYGSYFTNGGLTYIGLDRNRSESGTNFFIRGQLEQLLNETISRAITRGSGKKQKFILVTAPEEMDPTILSALMSRARSAGIAFIFHTSNLSALETFSEKDPGFLLQNTNFKLILRQGEPAGTELASRIILNTLEASEFRELTIGQAVLVTHRPNEKVLKVNIDH